MVTAETVRPEGQPRLAEILDTEASFVRQDVERLERLLSETKARQEHAAGQIAKLKKLEAQFSGHARSLSHDAASIDRVLKARRRVLFELEQES